jgi:hypothetical protein
VFSLAAVEPTISFVSERVFEQMFDNQIKVDSRAIFGLKLLELNGTILMVLQVSSEFDGSRSNKSPSFN